MNQNRTPLFDAVIGYIDEDVTPFHIPSHKMGNGMNPRWREYAGDTIFKMDIVEVQGLDDIHQPTGVIKEAQELAADAWGAKQSFFLVNGTSCGILSSICTVVGENEKIIIPRNAHKSVTYGMILSGAQPVYIPADIYKEKGLVGGFDPEKLDRIYSENPDAKAVFSVSPSYHGICSDIKRLAEVTHNHGGVFIADEAHGNHVYFNDKLPKGALKLGADMACHSIHKMCGSLTQSSMLHVNSDRIDIKRLKFNLQMFQNTSPSYLLETSLDIARHYMATQGESILDNLIELSSYARNEISKIEGFEVLGKELIGKYSIFDYEPIRIIFSAKALGIEGYELFEKLRYDYGIEMEFGDYFYGLCIMGTGTTKAHVDRLIEALKDISVKYSGQRKPLCWDEELPPLPPQEMTPREAYFGKIKKVPWKDAIGSVSAEMIVPYPPGIPTICPGEIITKDVWSFLDEQNKAGRHLHGPENGILTHISIVDI